MPCSKSNEGIGVRLFAVCADSQKEYNKSNSMENTIPQPSGKRPLLSLPGD